jgi:hypothetical protein
MSIEEIKHAITQLSKEELAELATWLTEYRRQQLQVTPIHYVDPTEPVAQEDWSVLQ